MLKSPFLRDVEVEACRAERLHGPFHSLHECYAVMLEKVDEPTVAGPLPLPIAVRETRLV